MNDIQTESPYYIFINGGDKMYVLGKTGQYEEELSKTSQDTEITAVKQVICFFDILNCKVKCNTCLIDLYF